MRRCTAVLQVLQLVVLPPHIKTDANAAISCRALLVDRLVELGIQLPPLVQWVTDSGPDEVSKLNCACNGRLVAAGHVTRLKHGRGQVAHNHSFLDQIGGILKADFKGNRNRTGNPAYSVAEVMENLRVNAKRHYPGYNVSTVLLNAAWDFAPLMTGLQPFTGNSEHRLMDVFAEPSPAAGMAAARCTMSLNIGSVQPRFMTSDDGGLVRDFELYRTPAGKALPLLRMAPHSPEGIAAAMQGENTLLKVASNPAKYGAGAPLTVTSEGAAACWAALSANVEKDVWVPSSETDEPPGFAPRPWINPGLQRQPADYVSSSVTGEAAVVPSAVLPDLPHVGKSKRLRESFVDPCDCPVPAIFECADGSAGDDPYAALAVVEAVAEEADGSTVYKCRWHQAPGPVEVGSVAQVKMISFPDEYIGEPEYTLLTADSRLNHGSNQNRGGYKGKGAKLNVTATGMAPWRDVVAEIAARACGGGANEAPEVVHEHGSRARAGKRRRQTPAAAAQ